MAEINVESLISLVEERPVLWDKTIELYKDKRRTFEAWREIFIILNDNFEKLGNTDKNEYGHLVIKKWTALRDCWMKCHRRLKSWKPTTGAKQCRKYVYYDEMLFLSKIAPRWDCTNDNTNEEDVSEKRLLNIRKRKMAVLASKAKASKRDINATEENSTDDTDDMEESSSEQTIPNSLSTIDPRMLQFKIVESTKNQEESRVMAFFKGIAPIVGKFSDDEMVDFQFEVLKAVRDIQKRRNSIQVPTVISSDIDDPLEYKPNISNLHATYEV